MSEWDNKTAHQAEQELLDAERDGADKSFHLGESDFRGNLTCDPSRHNLLGGNSTEYNLGWESEAHFARTMADMDAAKGAQLESEKATLRAMVNHTENIIRKLRLPSQRYKVTHHNDLDCVLNPDDQGFATAEAARLYALDLLDTDCVPGDTVLITEQGNTVELFTKEVD